MNDDIVANTRDAGRGTTEFVPLPAYAHYVCIWNFADNGIMVMERIVTSIQSVIEKHFGVKTFFTNHVGISTKTFLYIYFLPDVTPLLEIFWAEGTYSSSNKNLESCDKIVVSQVIAFAPLLTDMKISKSPGAEAICPF